MKTPYFVFYLHHKFFKMRLFLQKRHILPSILAVFILVFLSGMGYFFYNKPKKAAIETQKEKAWKFSSKGKNAFFSQANMQQKNLNNAFTLDAQSSGYTLKASFDWPSYTVGDFSTFCFYLVPSGTPYEAKITETSPVNQDIYDGQNDGTNYNDINNPACLNGVISDSDAPTLTFHVDAIINGQVVASIDSSATIHTAATNPTATTVPPIPTLQPTATPRPTIAASSTPTTIPSITPSGAPTTTVPPINTTTPTITQTPTDTTTPTTSPSENQTSLDLSITLPGIGNGTGDNPNPTRTSRQITLLISNSQSQNPTQATGNLTYNGSNGDYEGNISLANLTAGTYTVQGQFDNSIPTTINSSLNIANGTNSYTIPKAALISGDMNGDGKLTIQDYTNLIACLQGNSSCTGNTGDFNDDGKIDTKDLNILQRGFKEQQSNP